MWFRCRPTPLPLYLANFQFCRIEISRQAFPTIREPSGYQSRTEALVCLRARRKTREGMQREKGLIPQGLIEQLTQEATEDRCRHSHQQAADRLRPQTSMRVFPTPPTR